uniref:Guanylate cyclase n=1 Tax=Panagrolaimus superbus TaxID=310955 RepID=A0A914YPU6_9BILA
MWRYLLLFLSHFFIINVRLKVGLLFPNATYRLRTLMGFGQSAPAITLALKRVQEERMLPNVNFTFVWYMDQCDEGKAAGYTTRLIQNDGVHAIIGPPCTTSAIISGILGSFYNLPIFTWGAATSSELTDGVRFPTLANVNANTFSLGQAVIEIMIEYGWSEFALIYTLDSEQRKCDFLQQDLEAVSDKSEETYISFKRQIGAEKSALLSILDTLKSRARIIVVCFDDDDTKRRFLVAADEKGMNTDEYVYIFPDVRSQGMLRQDTGKNADAVRFWVDYNNPPDGLDDKAKATARRSIIIDLENQSTEEIETFNKEVQSLMGQYPFFVMVHPSVYVRSLHDATYMYARAVNKTLQSYNPDQLLNGSLVNTLSRGEFEGMTGLVRINENGTREPVFFVTALSLTDEPTVYARISIQSNIVSFVPEYQDEFTTIWSSRNNKRPLSVPICGFSGVQCAVSTTGYIVIGIGGGLIVLGLFIGAILFIWRAKMLEEKKMNAECLVSQQDLTKLSADLQKSDLIKSMRSMQSGHSSLTRTTAENHEETEHHAFFLWNKEIVFGSKKVVRPKFGRQEFNIVRKIRQFDHDNVNRLLAVCLDAPVFMVIWKYASRGSLKDVLAKDNYLSDSFFIFALMRDVAAGLSAIHSSFINVHGALTSECCLINDRWQVKISDYGLSFLRTVEPIPKKRYLWMAPEHIRSDDKIGSQVGDVYSFAIICSELINRRPAWNYPDREDEIDDIIFAIKRSSEPPARPEIDVSDDINTNLLHLIRDCWDENPVKRPTMNVVKSLIKNMNSRGKQSLMDYVFNMLEQYATSLEDEVEERTKELVEEKKKSDILLYRMLPKQVAEKLKLGNTVEPESFDMVTIFFSDVVSFTNLASKCTPLQVVNLLNNLYTTFDSIIDGHDVYKVETIGDGYLCVSGLPHRNGDLHVKEISDMSLAFLNILVDFRVPHLPNERINLRIGFHTGSAVAGVVGQTMPRYCLFGDTVNTASRMETGRIHMSNTANDFLTKTIGGYITEPRGEVIIKGKGVMETYWLIGKADGTSSIPKPPHSNSIDVETPGLNISQPHFPEISPLVPSMEYRANAPEISSDHPQPPTVSFNLDKTITSKNSFIKTLPPNIPPPQHRSDTPSTVPL